MSGRRGLLVVYASGATGTSVARDVSLLHEYGVNEDHMLEHGLRSRNLS